MKKLLQLIMLSLSHHKNVTFPEKIYLIAFRFRGRGKYAHDKTIFSLSSKKQKQKAEPIQIVEIDQDIREGEKRSRGGNRLWEKMVGQHILSRNGGT